MSLLLTAGSSSVTATATITQADNSVASTATVLVTGTLSKSQADQTASAVATVLVQGSLSATQADQSLSAAASVAITASLNQAQADNSIDAAATVVAEATVSSSGHSWPYPKHRRRRRWIYDEFGRRILLPLDPIKPVESEHERARRLKQARVARDIAAKVELDRQAQIALEQEREDIAILTLLLELVA